MITQAHFNPNKCITQAKEGHTVLPHMLRIAEAERNELFAFSGHG